MLKIKMLLARKSLLLIPFGLTLVLALSGCGYDTGAPTIPPSTPNQIVTKETDFGAGNFIRDGLISLLESFARLMGFVGVGVLNRESTHFRNDASSIGQTIRMPPVAPALSLELEKLEGEWQAGYLSS